MEDDELSGGACEQCGLCCRIFGPGITPTTMNLYIWMEQGRRDILVWFTAFREQGAPVNCADLCQEDLGDIVLIELRNPATGEFVTVCPFLQRIDKRRYLCSIHEIKPEMCDSYRPWIWGETYFNRCPAVRAGTPPER